MIPVARPDVGDRELAEMQDAVASGWIGLGPKVTTFEEQFSEEFGYEYAIATNSGTHALDLALKAAELRGTEVLVPPITWVSTAFVGTYNDLDIGWVDVRPDTLNMAPEALSDRISDDTAAVIPVHYGGQPAEIDEIVDIAHDHDALVVEDCAHAVGAESVGKAIGSLGDVGCFSFQATKPLTTGEGGMLVTDDEQIASTARRKSKLGVNKSTHERSNEDGYSWYYEVTDVGYKYFMHDIAAGMGLAQLERLPETRARRQEVAASYRNRFKHAKWIEPLRDKSDTRHAYYNFTVRVPSGHRDQIVAHLADEDVGATVHYMPLYRHPIFEEHTPELPITQAVWKQILTLPMSSTFSDDEVETVASALLSYAEGRDLSALPRVEGEDILDV